MNKYNLKDINLTNTAFLILTPIIAVISLIAWLNTANFDVNVVIFIVATYIVSGISITAGYHRLFAHKTYEANPLVKFLFLVLGATAFQNSVLKWASDHRLHHSKVDSQDDPYNINEGFFFAHMGWIFLNKNSDIKTRYAKDMLKDKLIMWQHNYYTSIAVFFGIVIPGFVAFYLFGNIYAAIACVFLRIALVHHCTFFINSLCHVFGSTPYTDINSAKDNWIMAYFTFGEGYHNFHHFFQTDFRNGIHWYDFDPTKWLIKFLSHAKLATNLKVTPRRSILKARLSMRMLAVKDVGGSRFSDLEELQKQILESLKNIENFKNELKHKKREFDSFSKKLMKRKISQAKKELNFHLILWKLSIERLEQSYI